MSILSKSRLATFEQDFISSEVCGLVWKDDSFFKEWILKTIRRYQGSEWRWLSFYLVFVFWSSGWNVFLFGVSRSLEVADLKSADSFVQAAKNFFLSLLHCICEWVSDLRGDRQGQILCFFLRVGSEVHWHVAKHLTNISVLFFC